MTKNDSRREVSDLSYPAIITFVVSGVMVSQSVAVVSIVAGLAFSPLRVVCSADIEDQKTVSNNMIISRHMVIGILVQHCSWSR